MAWGAIISGVLSAAGSKNKAEARKEAIKAQQKDPWEVGGSSMIYWVIGGALLLLLVIVVAIIIKNRK